MVQATLNAADTDEQNEPKNVGERSWWVVLAAGESGLAEWRRSSMSRLVVGWTAEEEGSKGSAAPPGKGGRGRVS